MPLGEFGYEVRVGEEPEDLMLGFGPGLDRAGEVHDFVREGLEREGSDVFCRPGAFRQRAWS